ncbi:MAG TPA: ankyrin repeat domain-containing protein, partial [Pyrinomonadaceae bacterium]
MTRAFPPEKHQKADARALFGAAEDGDAAAVARLLAAGAPADARLTHGGETPLMRAAARGHEDVARVLLDAGADASAQRADGFTPLILAVFFGHEGVVRLLVGRGADARSQTSLGTTAARWAASRGFDEMADLLRAAEAAGPRAVKPTPGARVPPGVSVSAASTRAAASARAGTTPSDEVSIFSMRGERRGSRGSAASDSALMDGAPAAAGASALNASPSDVTQSSASPSDTSQSGTSRSNVPSFGVSPSSAAAGVSVRRGGQVPAHPSSSTFRVGHFLRSWQGSVGTALLLLAFGVAVFALLRGGTSLGDGAPAPAAPQTPAPQAAAQVPPPAATEPTPAFPTPDAQSVLPVTDPAYAVPYTGGQPFYIQQGAPAPVQSNVPGDLTVVSDGGATPNENNARASRKTEAGANDATPARPDARGEPAADADARAPRPARTPDPEP